MRLADIYEFFIREGIASDLRTGKQIQNKLQATKRLYRKLSRLEQKLFDKDSLTNPYADVRILNGERQQRVRRALVGIDIEVGEILLADRLSQTKEKIDLVIAHHPEGKALAALHDVMDLQTDMLEQLGLKRSVAEGLMDTRMKEVARRLHAANHTRAVDAAKLLKIPLICCHTPSDNHVVKYLERKIREKKPKTLKNIIDLLLKEPEYQDAVINKAGPMILIGKPQDKTGKIIVDMTGGTEGSKDIFARVSQSGVDTLLCMHLSEEHFNKIKSEHINVIVAGHIASDNLGMNLLLDKLQKRSAIEFIECSGFKRVKRLWA